MERTFRSEIIAAAANYGKDGGAHSASTVTVCELDEGEVGILLTDTTHNILETDDLTSHVLTVPIIDDNISDTESASTETNCSCSQLYEPMDGNWFPSLSKASWIQDLDKTDGDDEDTLMTDTTMETLFASDILEMDDNNDNNNSAAAAASTTTTARYGRPSKSRRTDHGATSLGSMTIDIDDDKVAIIDSISSLENSSGLVPVNIVYSDLND